ncbi:sensor histidine kinase [Mesorhizobium shangrilense]|uniref:histidine kinase n=1 Tax=Mesorhizobium shangrilense TaxID=460060 RepID=A0ABV2DLN3_9HYPH
MRLADLSKTTSFRLAIAFLALFGLASLTLFAFISWEVKGFLSNRVDEWVQREGKVLSRLDATALAQRLDNRQRDDATTERPITLYDPAGKVLAGSPVPFPAGHDSATAPFEFGHGSHLPMAPFRGLTWRLPTGQTLLVAQSVDELNEFGDVLLGAMLLAGGVTTVLGLVGAILIGAGAVRQLDDITKATRTIVKGDLSGRLPMRGSGDVGRLVAVVNEMLDELQRLMNEVKGVCDNIAHEMRTPLTRLLAGLDRSRRRSSSTADYAESVDEAIAETQGILKTFGALLRISEIEDGARRAGFIDVDLGAIVTDAVEFYEPLADDRNITISALFEGETASSSRGDPSLLFEAFANLIDNAIKFTPAGGSVEVRLVRSGSADVVSVSDSGPGISEADRIMVLKRFYRAEPSRHEPGNGLGLSLVAAIARLHDMDMVIEGPPGCRIVLTRNRSEKASPVEICDF